MNKKYLEELLKENADKFATESIYNIKDLEDYIIGVVESNLVYDFKVYAIGRKLFRKLV